MSIENEELDIDNVEQIQEEELVDETQVDSYEENLEEKAKVKEEEEDDEDDDEEDEVVAEEEESDDEDEVEEMEMPKTKAGIVNATYSMMKKAKKDEAMKLYAGMQKIHANYGKGMDESVDVDETVVSETADVSHIDYEEDLNVLVAEEATLSDGFRDKASVIFEAALKTKVGAEIDRLESEYAQNLEEEVTSVKTDLVEKVDAYLNYVVEGWMQENEVAVEAGLRTEIAEDFMTSLQSVFKEHYISVPEGKEDLLDELSTQVAELEEQLNKTTDENVELFQSVQESQRADVVRKYTSDLATTEAEKLASLVEDVEFDNAETFEMKVKTIKESYFVKESVESVSEVEEIVGTEQAITESTSGSMARYTAALDTIGK